MPDIDPTSPADDSLVSAFPANERNSRSATETIIGAEHSETTGRHNFPQGSTTDRDGISDWERGGLFWNTTTGTLQRQTEASGPFAWANLTFPTGTKMLFIQTTPPAGWTQDNTVHDKVLRVIDNTATGAATGGSWTLSGLTNGTTGSTTLTESQIPSHTHGPGSGLPNFLSSPNPGGTVSYGGGANSLTAMSATAATGGGQGHTHPGSTITSDGNWRPAYVNAIVATKD